MKGVYSIFALLFVFLIFIRFIPERTPEEKQARTDVTAKVEKIMKTAQPGDMIVAGNNNDNYLLFIASAPFNGISVVGGCPIYGNQLNELFIGDVINVVGTDKNGFMYVVPEKNVPAALKATFGMAANFQK